MSDFSHRLQTNLIQDGKPKYQICLKTTNVTKYAGWFPRLCHREASCRMYQTLFDKSNSDWVLLATKKNLHHKSASGFETLLQGANSLSSQRMPCKLICLSKSLIPMLESTHDPSLLKVPCPLVSLMRLGAKSLIDWPWSHRSIQNLVLVPSPASITMVIANKAPAFRWTWTCS